MQAFDPIGFSLWLYGAQALAAAALAVIFAGYYRSFRRNYLGLWAGGFFAMALYHVCAGIAVVLLVTRAAGVAERMGLTIYAQVASYLEIALLVLGTFAIADGRRWSRTTLVATLGAAVAIALACSFVFLDEPAPAPYRLFARVGLRHVVTGLAFIALAVVLLRRIDISRGVGRRATAFAFAAWGLEQFCVFLLLLRQSLHGETIEWTPFLGIVDLTCLVFAGLGLVIWLLDEERARADAASEQVERLERYDVVTGLPNERNLRERIANALDIAQADGGTGALMLVDLDRFELLVGSLRTQTAEHTLMIVAARLQRVLPDAKLPRPARLEGHRFAYLLPPQARGTVAERLGLAVQAALAEPLDLGTAPGRALQLTASIGIARIPEHGDSADELIRSATLAMQHVRERGGNAIATYSPELRARAQQRLALESELRRAFDRQEFVLYYQPVVRPKDHRLEGFEALVRWRHPDRGVQAPGAFLGAIEELGLLPELDAWVMDTACARCALWNENRTTPLFVAVNVSAHSLRLEDFNRRVVDTLMRTGLAPAQLDLELTESTALANVEHAVSVLRDLREVGVSASLDDFGTGYSSLSQLRVLPVRRVKLDRSFIADAANLRRDGAIVRALVSLAHGLGLEVVVEGVETEEQVQFCQRAGADFVQGYYFSAPMALDACNRLVAERDGVVPLARVKV
ncbi:MAG TPA: phosphodiesterase [Xanthomonadales bacterium]|nr:phosphodiesterase [Xanthomonadales bacterium]